MEGVVLGLIPAGWIAKVTFWAVCGVTIMGALLAVSVKNIFHNVLGLAISLFGVAGIFLYLGSPFVAIMEILIYVGAVCIAIVFAVMLGRPLYLEGRPRAVGKTIAAALISGVVFVSLAGLVLAAKWSPAAKKISDFSVEAVGKSLLTTYALVFELISVVLLVARSTLWTFFRAESRQSR